MSEITIRGTQLAATVFRHLRGGGDGVPVPLLSLFVLFPFSIFLEWLDKAGVVALVFWPLSVVQWVLLVVTLARR